MTFVISAFQMYVLHFGHVSENQKKTRVSHRVKMMTRWSRLGRWPKWPIDPMTQFHVWSIAPTLNRHGTIMTSITVGPYTVSIQLMRIRSTSVPVQTPAVMLTVLVQRSSGRTCFTMLRGTTGTWFASSPVGCWSGCCAICRYWPTPASCAPPPTSTTTKSITRYAA